MEITEVRVTLCEATSGPAHEPRRVHGPAPDVVQGGGEGRSGARRLKAYATITFDNCFVVRNIKIIDGKSGLFVAMPSRKPKVACARCSFKNDLGGRYCCQCASPLSQPAARTGVGVDAEPSETQAHRDIAHPIAVEFRLYLQQKILEAYEAERAKGGVFSPSRTEDAG